MPDVQRDRHILGSIVEGKKGCEFPIINFKYCRFSPFVVFYSSHMSNKFHSNRFRSKEGLTTSGSSLYWIFGTMNNDDRLDIQTRSNIIEMNNQTYRTNKLTSKN